MDHEAPFLMALGMLIAASLVVSISGWVLFARDRALHRAAVHAGADTDVHHEAADEE
jgi:hypothetical protein